MFRNFFKNIFDYDDGDFIHSTGGNTGIDDEGHMHMRMVITCLWIWTLGIFTSHQAGPMIMTLLAIALMTIFIILGNATGLAIAKPI